MGGHATSAKQGGRPLKKSLSPRIEKLNQEFEKNGGEWREYELGQLFEFKAMKQAKSQRDIPTDNSANGINYIVQSMFNNMFSRKVNKQYLIDHDEPIVSGNRIVLGVTLPAVSYQPEEFGASQVITATADWLNARIGLYLVSLLEKQMYQFSYSRKPGLEIYKRMSIELPTLNSEIAFSYMENYIKALEAERIETLEAYLTVTGLNDYHLTKKDEQILDTFTKLSDTKSRVEYLGISWQKYAIVDIFDVRNTHNILKSWVKENSGTTPYVTASQENNSISTYIDYDTSMLEEGNSIFIGGKTLVISYQAQDYFSNDSHNLALYLKKEEREKENQLFLATSLYKSLQGKYSWGNSISRQKIQEDVFYLPADNGEIDYDFMSAVIVAVQKLVIKDLVEWTDKKLEATREVVSR